MRNFGEIHRAVRRRLANGIGTDKDAIKTLMLECRYSEIVAQRCVNGMKKGIAKDIEKKKEKDMRTKGNRAKKMTILVSSSVEDILKSYEERGRLLKGEIDHLFNLAKKAPTQTESTSPLDAFKYPENEVFENFDNEQIVTLGVGIGTWMLMLLDKNLPEHTLLARKDRVGEVQRSILALAQGLGKPLSKESLDYWCAVWNLTWNMAMDKIKKDHETKEIVDGENEEVSQDSK